MATYTVTSVQRLDDYAVIQTLEPVAELATGQDFTLGSLAETTLNGAQTIYALPEYEYIGVDSQGDLLFNGAVPRVNQILFYDVGDDIGRATTNSVGTFTFTLTCTWVTGPSIKTYLGITTEAADDAFLVQCAAASNAFAYRRRIEAGYSDSLTTSPGGDATLGTLMIGGAYFRQRSSYNNVATFDGLGVAPSNGINPMVMQLLGINRPAVA